MSENIVREETKGKIFYKDAKTGRFISGREFIELKTKNKADKDALIRLSKK